MIRYRHYRPNKFTGSSKMYGWSLSYGLRPGEWTLDFYIGRHVFVFFRSKL